MNRENGLPAEVQKFLETYLPHAEDQRRFLETYRSLDNEIARRAFLQKYAEEPTDQDIQGLNQSRLN